MRKAKTIVFTKDGRRIGNAVIADVINHPLLGTVFCIVTDSGNTARFTDREMRTCFHDEESDRKLDDNEFDNHPAIVALDRKRDIEEH